MADPLYELLAPYFDNAQSPPSSRDPQTAAYLTRLSTLSLSDILSAEPASLLQAAQSHLRNLQALSKRSHKAVISSSSHLAHLKDLLPSFRSEAQALSNDLPALESAAVNFAQKYDRSTENAVLDRRKRAALLARNVDRISDVLDLPSLLSSTVAAAQASAGGTSSAAGASTTYASALDIHAHIKRLKALYPRSEVVANIARQSDTEIQNLASILITSLQSQSLKLAAAMRTVGLLRRVAPDLIEEGDMSSKPNMPSATSFELSVNATSNEGALGALFLICRLYTLHKTLEALDPLRELADQDREQREAQAHQNSRPLKEQTTVTSALGSHSERYLKRYIELFREQSFSILSMYKSIFPSNLPEPEHGQTDTAADPLLPLPSPVASFALHLVDMLEQTLREYLPNVPDKSARESLLTQVLYCSGSLGRLGAEFGMMVALLDDDLAEELESADAIKGFGAEEEPEWVQVMKKHRVQASRLEVLARGVGTGRKAIAEIQYPTSTSPAPTALPS